MNAHLADLLEMQTMKITEFRHNIMKNYKLMKEHEITGKGGARGGRGAGGAAAEAPRGGARGDERAPRGLAGDAHGDHRDAVRGCRNPRSVFTYALGPGSLGAL